MPLSVKELVGLIAHKIDTSEQGAMPALGIVNEAGRFIVAQRNWSWTLRPPTVIGTIGGQSWVSLKSDFGRLAGRMVSHPNAQRVRNVVESNLDIINRLRATQNPPIGMDGDYLGAVVFSPLSPPGGPPMPRMELWPTPPVTDGSAFSCAYYANWVDVTSDDVNVDVPWYIEGLMRHAVREVAAGYEHDDKASIWDRTNEIVSSAIWRGAVVADQGVQTNLGQGMGGAAQAAVARRMNGGSDSPFYPVHI